MKTILASKSPRRKELLSKIVSDFEIIVSDADETVEDGMHPRDAAHLLARRKGEGVARENPDAVVVSSDTLVELCAVPLGKPTSKADAERMLSDLSGKTHNVHTGVAVHYKGKVLSSVDSAAVTFRKIEKEEILWYIETGEPMDKAGAYAIQGLGNRFIEKYDGEFDTVMGLSVKLTKELIEKITDGKFEFVN